MKMENLEDSAYDSSTLLSDEEMREPIDYTTRKPKSPAALWGVGSSSISKVSQSYERRRTESSPYQSPSSSASEYSNSMLRTGDISFRNYIPPPPCTMPPTPPSIPLTRRYMESCLPNSSSIIHLNNGLSIERVRKRPSRPNLLSRNQTPTENMSVHSNARINMSSKKSSSKRYPSPEDIPLTAIPPNSFTGNSYRHFSESELSSDDKEYNNNNISNVNRNIVNNTPFANDATSSSPLLMPGLASALSLQALQSNPNLMYLQYTNPLFLAAFYNIINQNVPDFQPAASSFSPHSVKPSFPKGPHIPLMAPHLSIPTVVPSFLPTRQNPFSGQINKGARSQEFRESTLLKEQVGNKRRKCYDRRNFQNSEETSSEDSSRASREEKDRGRTPREVEDSCKTPREEADSGRTPVEEADSCITPVEEADSCITPVEEADSCITPVEEADSCRTPRKEGDSGKTSRKDGYCSKTSIDECDRNRYLKEEKLCSRTSKEKCHGNKASMEECDRNKASGSREEGYLVEDDKKPKNGLPNGTVKDEAYRERRRKNNEAAKKSRDSRRLKNEIIKTQTPLLLKENEQLWREFSLIKAHLIRLKESNTLPKRPLS